MGAMLFGLTSSTALPLRHTSKNRSTVSPAAVAPSRRDRPIARTISLSHRFGAAERQGMAGVRQIGEGRYEIIAWCQHRLPAVRVDQRPVLQMHVGIADQGVEHQSSNEFPYALRHVE